jgi:uncharacterized protein (TIGR03437 family)
MLLKIAILSLLLVGSIPAQVQLQFPSALIDPEVKYSIIVPLAGGGRLLVGTRAATSLFGTARQAFELDAIGTAAFTGGARLGGNGDDKPAAAAIDPQGNIWIVGSTTSDDFNLVNPIVSRKAPYRAAGFVAEIDPTGSQLLFATYLCGEQPGVSFTTISHSSYASQIVFDASGNAYVAGATDETDFPVTPGAFQTKGGGVDEFGNTLYYGFVVKISSAGRLLYGTFLGGNWGDCSGGSSCIAKESTYAYVNGMAVDPSGSVTLSGITNATNFPVTASAPQQSCNCSYPYGSGFVTRLSPDASKVLWSTYVSFVGATTYLGMAQDSQGNLDLFGEYAPYTGMMDSFASVGAHSLFVAEFSADGSPLTAAMDLDQLSDAAAHGIALDSAGNEYLTGTSSSAFPTFPDVPNLGADFVLRLSAASSKAQSLVRLPTGTISGPPVFDGSGNLLLVSAQNAVLQLPAELATTTPGVVGFANAASFAWNLGLYPGALVSLFGFDLAPAAQSAAPGASGNFPTTLGGVQVLMNGFPSPLLYVGPNQINLQVPFEIGQTNEYSPQIQVQVILPSGTLAMQFAESESLGLFTDGGGLYAAALNQDGTVNSAANPATAGSVVSLFGTGAIWPSALADGALAAAATPVSQELFQIEALVGNGVGTNILYAGAAPGLIDGVFQLNVQLPVWVTNPVLLTLSSVIPFGAEIASNGVQLYIR